MNSEFAIVEEKPGSDYKTVVIDTEKAHYQGTPWRTLGDYGKRKFENLVFLSYPKDRIKFIYV